jgi:hypothetical protein
MALLKILALGNRQIEVGKPEPASFFRRALVPLRTVSELSARGSGMSPGAFHFTLSGRKASNLGTFSL